MRGERLAIGPLEQRDLAEPVFERRRAPTRRSGALPARGAMATTVPEHSVGAPAASWMSVERAAEFLQLPVVTLRRSFERNARVNADGATVARADGITARKVGRLWRVWLDAGWLSPTSAMK